MSEPGAPDPFAGRAPGAPDPDDGPAPTLLTAAWQQAETRLYPAVMDRPDLYQRIVRLVRLTADSLRPLGPGTTALVAAAGRGGALVAATADDAAIPTAELDLDLVAGAAVALRYRELRAEQAARRRLRRLAEGRAAGHDWVVVDETGEPDGDPFIPYSRLEVHTATGRALLVTATPDDEFRDVHHEVRPVRLDPETGEVTEDPAAPEPARFQDAEQRDAFAAAQRTPPRA